jgi:hypothetical protein
MVFAPGDYGCTRPDCAFLFTLTLNGYFILDISIENRGIKF